jgi:PKD repeat protein
MAVRDVFSARLLIDLGQVTVGQGFLSPVYEDITSGILNVDITYGTETYEGPWQQIDTGQFTMVTRNPALDPKLNPNIQYSSVIDFLDSRNDGVIFFRGYVTDIDVEYQRNDDPIITITGTDAFGLMQRAIVSQQLVDDMVGQLGVPPEPEDANGMSLYGLTGLTAFQVPNVRLEYKLNTTPGQIEPALPYEDYSVYAPSKLWPEVGETHLEVLNKHAQTNLNYFSIIYEPNYPNETTIEIYPFAKYNDSYWAPIQDPALEFPTLNFSSDPADGRPYESILINNGYNRVMNTIAISNEFRTRTDTTLPPNGETESTIETFGLYVSTDSNIQFGSTRANLSTTMPSAKANNEEMARYSRDIFQVVAFPSDEIQQITFDNARYEDIENDYSYSNSRLNQFIRIKHKVNETETIDRFYDIAGIRHSITPDKWEMSFTFKPSQQEIAFTYQGQVPTIQMNSLTGDANFNFTATITDYPTEDIDQVIWCLNGTNDFVPEQWFFTADGSRYKDGLPKTGLTQTWNFDDDGILEGPTFETGGYGPGEWYVIPYIFLKNGWIIAPNVKLTVGTPEVEARFNWTQNLTNNFGQVQFVDDSRNNETGEPDSYLWTFGDGTTSTLQNPLKTYVPVSNENSYTVSLKVFAYGPGGTKVYNTKTSTVTLTQPTMTPNFTWLESPAGTIVFTNTSTNVGFEEPDAYFWQFGDGNTSTLKNPTHTYVAPPTVSTDFSVTLTTRNIWEQTASVTKTITVSPLYFAGTLPVNELRVVRGIAPSALTPLMASLRALRSDNVNLSFNATTTRANVSGQIWRQRDNTVPPLSGTNLTRNPATSSGIYGLQFANASSLNTTQFSLNTTIPTTQNINSIRMLFDDRPAEDYPSYDWDRYYLAMNDSFGGTFPVGYWDLPAIPNFLPRQSFGRDYAMTPIRPMPPRIPYFKYTFNNRIVSFTSMETADSYAWNFGDGTTSTLRNPVKTYSSQGTYNVSLAVTNGGVVTRTTTEPVIVEALVNYPVRYMKFAQKEHTGLNAWDTPYVADITPSCNRNQIQQTNPESTEGWGLQPINVAYSEGYSMEWYAGTASPDAPNDPRKYNNPVNPSLQDNKRPWVNSAGLRVKSLDGTFRTKWEIVGDFGVAINNINKFNAHFSRWSNWDGTPNPVCAGISYEVYVTDYVGLPSGIAGATWTKIGEFNPTNMPLNPTTNAGSLASIYTMTPL